MIRVVLLSFLIFFSFCGKSAEQSEISEWAEKGALVVDVRSPGEFSGEHFPGAVNIPLQVLGSRLEELGSKDRPIVLYCHSGGRSARAKSILSGEGFTRVKDAGGFRDLLEALSKD